MYSTARTLSAATHRFCFIRLALVICLAAAPGAHAQTPKKVLTIEDYARWKSIENSRISGDGNWVAYVLRHPNALDQQPVLHIRRLDTNRDEEIANAVQPAFSDDSRWVAYYVELPYADAKKLRDATKPVPRKAGTGPHPGKTRSSIASSPRAPTCPR